MYYSTLGDLEDCTVSKVHQTSFTPLPDAVCWVILQLGAAGQNAVLDSIQSNLVSNFPDIEQPSRNILYDTLADLMSGNKVRRVIIDLAHHSELFTTVNFCRKIHIPKLFLNRLWC